MKWAGDGDGDGDGDGCSERVGRSAQNKMSEQNQNGDGVNLEAVRCVCERGVTGVCCWKEAEACELSMWWRRWRRRRREEEVQLMDKM